jgi:acetyl-CoA carboxylase carboxyltransferase component
MTLRAADGALRRSEAHAQDGRVAVRRLELICDPGSLRILPPPASDVPVGVVGGFGTVDGRPLVCYAQDGTLAGGSVGILEGDAIVGALRAARARKMPVVSFLESAGARLQEGAAALGAFARIFFENVALSSDAPQISVITGTSAGGGCYSPALTDFIVMTEPSAMFLTGPGVIREVTGEHIAAADLGGPQVHQRTGVCHFVARDDRDAAAITRRLIGYLCHTHGNATRASPEVLPQDDPGRHVPSDSRRVYDVRHVACSLVDAGELLEVAPKWSRNLVTAFGRVAGRGVGIIANQPQYLGGVLDIGAAQKGAGFVATCNRFGLPLVVLVDTPGFMPGARLEAGGIIRHGAELVRAFATATVPRVTVVLRKAYGGGYITMNSKDLGADLALAWKGAQIGVMGARAAVQIIHRRDLAAHAAPDALADMLAKEYAARHISADHALASGVIDGVIRPRDTRSRLAAALLD